MSYFENSLIYRIIAGSWFFGWLFSTPEEQNDYYTYSFFYKWSSRLISGITGCLQRLGRLLITQGQTSLIINNPVGFLGLLLFFYFGFDLSLNDYGLKRIFIDVFLMIAGILLCLFKNIPGIYQGSMIYRLFTWWIKTE